MSDERIRNLELVQQAQRLIAQEGLPAVLERFDDFFADDLEWYPAILRALEGRETGEGYRGRAGLAQYVDDIAGSFEVARLGWDFGIPFGDAVFSTGRMDAVGRGSGVPVEAELATLFRLRDGRIHWGRSYTDVAVGLHAAADLMEAAR